MDRLFKVMEFFNLERRPPFRGHPRPSGGLVPLPDVEEHTAAVVVIADWFFTAPAVVAQPVTGVLLANALGWKLTEGWLLASIALYILIGALWLPVVWMQTRMRDLARVAAAENAPLPARYHRLYRWWFACGVPAFAAILALLWLMLMRPAF